MTELFVTFDHLHSVPGTAPGKSGFCHRTSRELCERYGIDWVQVVRDGGIAAEKLIATGDALALRVVEHARFCEGLNRG